MKPAGFRTDSAGGAMSLLVRTRATVDGTERDVLVEVRKLDIVVSEEGRVTALLDDYTIFADPGFALQPIDTADPEDIASAAEIVIEGTIA